MNPQREARLPVQAAPGPRAFLIALLAAAGLLAFTGIRPSQPWLLLFTAVVVALAAAGTLRATARVAGRSEFAALGLALLPAVCTVAAGAFADQLTEGYLRALIAGGAGLSIGALVYAEFRASDRRARPAGPSRLILAAATYAGAFAIFSVMFQPETDVVASTAVVGVAAWVFATTLLSGRGVVGRSALLAGFAVGISVGELRATLHYFPVDGVAGGVVLLLGFHVAAGLLHHLLERDLTASRAAEYALTAAAVLAAVVFLVGAR